MTTFNALPTDIAHAYQNGAPDAFGNAPERLVSTGPGNPCRHCLKVIPEGAPMLVLAHKPFAGTHAYSEVGPIFLCADQCDSGSSDTAPEVMETSPDYLLKGYGRDDRIIYGTGAITPQNRIEQQAHAIFEDPAVAYIHVRSARNNCYLLRMDRGS